MPVEEDKLLHMPPLPVMTHPVTLHYSVDTDVLLFSQYYFCSVLDLIQEKWPWMIMLDSKIQSEHSQQIWVTVFSKNTTILIYEISTFKLRLSRWVHRRLNHVLSICPLLWNLYFNWISTGEMKWTMSWASLIGTSQKKIILTHSVHNHLLVLYYGF